jgi:ankyrin repeat protein
MPGDQDANRELVALINTNVCSVMQALVIERGADVNIRGNRGITPLIWAARMGRSGLASVLLDLGADVNLTDEDGATALMAGLAYPEVVRTLLEYRADVDSRDKWGWTALMCACRDVLPVAVRILVRAGASVDREALHLAARGNYSPDDTVRSRQICKTLLDAGANIDGRAADGRTALMSAAAAGNLPVVRLLLARGADVEARMDGGETALMLAEQRRARIGDPPEPEVERIVRLLRRAGTKK